MPRPAATVPAGARFGHFVVVEEVGRLTPRERAFRCRLACCDREVVVGQGQMCGARARATKCCRACDRPRAVEAGRARRAGRRARQDEAARGQLARTLIRNDIDPGAHLHEINYAVCALEPCTIESLSDFRRALAEADCAGLFGTVRADFVGELAS